MSTSTTETITSSAATVNDPLVSRRNACTTATMGFGYENEVAITMARGFMEDPLMNALAPEPALRRVLLWCFFTSYFPSLATSRCTVVRRCFSKEVPAMGDTKGATIWATAPHNTFQEIWIFLTLGFLAWWNIGLKGLILVLRNLTTFSYVASCEARIMGKDSNYMKLIAIAVDPSMRSGGLGSLVIQPELDLADSKNLPCYLESSNLKNLTFYKRAGFEVVETIKLFGVPITLMKRPRASDRKSL
ncbi:hypothetical protein Pelo_15112 [Pelomyxa schiedti]|nr:hypothetical protein Pelo_15112 [Pelomyxa schiedti]